MKTFYVLRCVAVGAAVLTGLSQEASAAPIISAGSVWKYWDAGTDPGPTWATPGFNDSAWMSGPGQLGFGDGDEATLLQRGIVTAYFRHGFSVADVAAVSNLTARVLRDDGVAVYLNGVEVFRNNLPPGPLNYNTLATIAAPDENAYLEVSIASTLLVAGQNVIAAEVHQVNLTSSDLGFDLELRADGTSPPDPELPVVTLAAVDGSASEQGPETGQFRLTRTGATNETLHVSLRFSGTAGNGVDCSPLPATVDIPAGVGSVELTVQPIDDALVEGTETLVLELEPPACLNQTPPGPGCYRVGVGQATVEILDNDTLPDTGPVALIRSNSVWKYLDNGTDPGSAWRAPGFDDSTWASGPGQLGYGDGDEATVVSFGPDPANKFITTYFRRSFEVVQAAALSNLVMHVLRDDGVAVYLNGVEVFRNNLPAGPIDFHTLATAVAADENVYVPVAIPSSALVSGRNVIAAEVHQVNVTSSDLGFDLALFASGAAGTNQEPAGSECSPRVEWQASYGGSALEYFNSVRPTADGGFILGGYSTSGADGNKTTPNLGGGHDFDWWIVRTDAAGTILWQRSLGGSGNDVLLALEPVSDGGFIAGGYRRDGYFAISRLDANGNILWGQEYEDGAVSSIQELPEGGFVVGGWTYAGGVPGDDPELGGGGGTNFRIMRIDPNGTVIWDRRFGGNAVDQAYAVRQTSDGGFLLAGASDSGISGNKTSPLRGSQDMWIIRLDGAGNRIWEQTYGFGYSEAHVLHPLSDGSFIVGGSVNAHFHLMRVGSTGDVLWAQSVGGSAWTMLSGLELLSDGGFLLSGRTTEGDQGTKTHPGFGADDFWIVRLSADRRQIWDLTVGGSANDFATTMTLTPDGGVAVGGHSASGISGNKTSPLLGGSDYWLVKLGPEPACDTDGDGVADALDRCPQTPRGVPVDSHGCPIVVPLDADGDGVPNESDQCANTPAGAIVDAHGCALSQLCPCDAQWANHGDYVQCVISHAWEFFRAGLISDEQRREIISAAGRSDCGHSPGVAERLRVHLVPRTLSECQRDGLGIVVSGDASGACVIETSTDLRTWTSLRTMSEAEMGAEISCPHTTAEASRFFRVRIAP
jgi:hypothetical protein